MATTAATMTLTEIDAALIQLRWKWLHEVWECNEMGVQLALVQQDALLEQRFKLTQATRSG